MVDNSSALLVLGRKATKHGIKAREPGDRITEPGADSDRFDVTGAS